MINNMIVVTSRPGNLYTTRITRHENDTSFPCSCLGNSCIRVYSCQTRIRHEKIRVFVSNTDKHE